MTVAKKIPKHTTPLISQILELGGTCSINGLSKEKFKLLASLNPELQMEREKNGKINIMAPVKGGSGIRENRLNYRLRHWREKNDKGECFSPSTGFDLPSGAVKSPDAAWLSAEKMNSLTEEQIEDEYIPAVPDFIVEIRSKTDRLSKLKQKMEKTWMANGVRLGWLIDPYKEKAYIYRLDGSKEVLEGFDRKLSGEDVLEGFELDLREFKVLKKKK